MDELIRLAEEADQYILKIAKDAKDISPVLNPIVFIMLVHGRLSMVIDDFVHPKK